MKVVDVYLFGQILGTDVRFYIIDSFCSFDEGAGGKVSCVKSVFQRL